MKITLESKTIEKHSTMGEILLMLAIANKADLILANDELIDKGLITKDYSREGNYYRVTNKGHDLLNTVIIDSEIKDEKNEYEDLAKELKEIYPKGKKPGTNDYWTDGNQLLVKRLKIFEKKYGKFKHEDIIETTKRYVESFNGNYRTMRLLKYFIFKEENKNGEIESKSDLLTFMENKDEDNKNISQDWTSQMI